jgi:hypothetical protein
MMRAEKRRRAKTIWRRKTIRRRARTIRRRKTVGKVNNLVAKKRSNFSPPPYFEH